MAFTPDDIRSNRAYFLAKLKAERQWVDVMRRAKGEPKHAKDEWVLLDLRGRDAFAKAHIQGSLCVPLDELDALSSMLPKDREIVSYCWTDT
jgi:rhodanese-related sulfurtransferase